MSDVLDAAELFARLKQHKTRVAIEGKQYWLLEGDLLADEDRLWGYTLERIEQTRAQEVSQYEGEKLVSMTDGGRVVCWRRGKVITYTVRRSTFSAGQYELLVGILHNATADWEAVCGVNFRHLVDFDTENGNAAELPLFDVAYVPKVSDAIATAFFPNDPVESRHIYIYPSFFDADLFYDQTGVLRHELGHVLGFRHEQIRSGAPADCPKEEWMDRQFELGAYDPKSVMHYFCGGVGTQEMRITEVDRVGAQRVYGLPDHLVQQFE